MRRLLGIAVVLAVACAGCGGDKQVTRADYLADAARICNEFEARGLDISDRYQDLGTEAHSKNEFLAKAVPVLEELVDLQRDQLAAVRELEPPDADRDTIDKIIAGAERRNDMLEDVVDAARKRDVEQFTTRAEDLRAEEMRVREMAVDYGFDQCYETDDDGAA
jgi:hypothetical protein